MKLVRDRIRLRPAPEGTGPQTFGLAAPNTMDALLRTKLVEEEHELDLALQAAARVPPGEPLVAEDVAQAAVDEAADCIEVILARACQHPEITREWVMKRVHEKFEERGGFTAGVVLEEG